MTAADLMRAVIFLIVATTMEVSGDAIVRVAIHNHAGWVRVGIMACGALLLLGYGSFLNLAPLEFGRIAGLYIAILFVVWQIVNFVAFRSLPSAPILIGGVLIISGGLVVSFWKAA
ncbi:MAG: hypothetical protein QM718_11970 [Steroidobacteraceae bacterium]